MAQRNELIKEIDKLPWLVKLIFCLPALDFLWAIYRIIRGVTESNLFLLVIGIIWLLGAISIGWIIDLVTVIIFKHPMFA